MVPYPGVIEPWVGYFILAGKNCEMLIPAEEVGSKGKSNCPVKEWRGSEKVIKKESKSSLFGTEDTDGFTIQLTAKMGSLIDEFYFGKKYHKPPKLFIDTKIFAPSGIRFNLLSESKNNEKTIYEFVLERWGDTKEVKIEWDIKDVPEEYYVYLKDKATGKMIDMRNVISYEYTSSAKERQFGLIVSSTPVSDTQAPILSIKDVFCYPNPTKGDKITFKLPEGKIRIKIYNIAGEEVLDRELQIPAYPNNQWYWDCRNNDKEKVSSGIYIYVISDGKTTKTGKLGIIR
jgi:hypothetical protein